MNHQSTIQSLRISWLSILLLIGLAIQLSHLYVAERRLISTYMYLSPWVLSGDEQPNQRPATSTADERRRKLLPEDTAAATAPDGFDTIAPPIIRGVTHLLPSIPSENRIPLHGLRNTTAYFHNWSAGVNPDALFIYNPSIIALPASSLAGLFNSEAERSKDMNGTNHPSPSRPPVYLASYRLSSVHSCGFPTYAFWDHPRNLFGFALLDANLELIPGYDVVIDLNSYFGKRMKFEDLRLFEIDGRIYMSSYEKLVPITISYREKNSSTKSKRLTNLFGDGLEVSLSGDVVSIGEKGKNYQFFRSGLSPGEKEGRGDRGKVLVETWPANPRVVLTIDLESTNTTSGRWRVPILPTMTKSKSKYLPSVESTLDASLTRSTRMFIGRDRGTACCVRIDNVHFRDLVSNETVRSLDFVLVGVAHTKSHQRMPSSQGNRFNYLSRLYAFSPYPPYAVVARSELLCFGFPQGKEMEADPYAELTRSKKLELHDEKFDCGNIHFVSSMCEKVGNESKMIIAYGINDCVSRMVEIEKRAFAEHLFTAR